VIKQAPVKGRNAIKVSFVLPQDAIPGKTSVVGDFNGWDPLAQPLRPRANGTRSAAVTLPPGRRFAFRYLAEGGRWHDDDTVEAFEPNGAGATTPSSTHRSRHRPAPLSTRHLPRRAGPWTAERPRAAPRSLRWSRSATSARGLGC
jgi:hypothetical protein